MLCCFSVLGFIYFHSCSCFCLLSVEFTPRFFGFFWKNQITGLRSSFTFFFFTLTFIFKNVAYSPYSLHPVDPACCISAAFIRSIVCFLLRFLFWFMDYLELRILFNFHTLVNFPNSFLVLIPNLIWLESFHGQYSEIPHQKYSCGNSFLKESTKN